MNAKLWLHTLSVVRGTRAVPLVVTLAIAAFALGERPLANATHGQQPTRTCSTPSSTGFDRDHPYAGGSWNWCKVDTYGPPEYLYWNVLPGWLGYNNPGAFPYYGGVASAISNWAGVMSPRQVTYKSGDWSSGTDIFFVGPTDLGGSVAGRTDLYRCTSPTVCSAIIFDSTGPTSKYNLSYIYLDDGIAGYQTEIVGHELGHTFSLRHITTCSPNTIMFPQAGVCSGNPTVDDAAAVDLVYPDP